MSSSEFNVRRCSYLLFKRFGFFSVALLTAIASIWQGCVAHSSMQATLTESLNATKRGELNAWQNLTVFRLVRKAGIDGITSDTLLEQYRQETLHLPDELVSKEEKEKQVDALERVLASLEMTGLVYLTIEGKYHSQLSVVNPRASSAFASQEAKYAILKELVESSGKFTVPQLLQKLNLVGDETNIAINELAANGFIMVDKNSKVHSILQPPPTAPDGKSTDTNP